MNHFESLRDHVYNYISKKIQLGELEPNQKISEAEICNALSISRTPAREALIKLASDNLLEYVPRRGFFVKEIPVKEKVDTYLTIGILDGAAAALAMDSITEEDLNKMSEIVESIDRAIDDKDYNSYTKLQFEFHNIYIKKCKNNSLIQTINTLENSFMPITYVNKDLDLLFSILKDLNEEHGHIIDLFRKKDKTGLENFLRNVHWITKYLNMI